MITAAIEKVLGLAIPNRIQIDDRQYVDKQIHAIKPPTQAGIQVMTLTAIKDYYQDNPDKLDLSRLVAHISAHNNVNIISAIKGEWLQRDACLTATIKHAPFAFGQYIDIEMFMISLQTHFVQTETTKKLLQVVGNLTSETGVTTIDDGVTQQVQAKSGIARISNISLPNPVNLAPYRTFTEIEQPESAFVFRLKKNSEGSVTAALFEADGGNWQLTCIQRVREWLGDNIPTGTTILA